LAGNNPGVQPIKALPPHPEERPPAPRSKDAPDGAASWFETREDALLTIRYGEETRGEMQKE